MDFDLVAEYMYYWTKVKDANFPVSPTYGLTRMIRNNFLDDLIRYLANYAIIAGNHKYETMRYRSIYRYIHFHFRNWEQFQKLQSLPVI